MVEHEANTSREFRDVDATASPSTHVRYLQAVSSLEQVQAFKRRSLDLLDLRPGGRVLDAGCGVGDEVRRVAEVVGPGGRAIGVDSSAVMIVEARRRSEGLGLPAEFRTGDLHDLDFPDNTFDGCRAERVLQHLDDPQCALAELVRVAKSGAPIVALEPDWESLILDLPDRALARKIVQINCDRLIRNAWIGRELYRRFRQVKLIDVTVEFVGGTLTDPTLARSLLNLDAIVRYGRENGLLSASEEAAWSRHLEATVSNGLFFAALGVFIAAGRKPIT